LIGIPDMPFLEKGAQPAPFPPEVPGGQIR
jgi:hypothetical protein